MARVVVDVMPKPEILDPQGKAVTGALGRLGYSGLTVRQGKRFEVEVDGEITDERLAEVRDAAEKLFANTVIETFDVRVDDRQLETRRLMAPRIGVVTFPGSLDDHDALRAVRLSGAEAVPLWHGSDSLTEVDAVILPGGFSYGDYLRCGAIARFAPVMTEVIRAAGEGMPVLGICNGFQVLCEAHLLPGALIRNERQTFVCRDQRLRVESVDTTWTSAFTRGSGDHHRAEERRGSLPRRHRDRGSAGGGGAGRLPLPGQPQRLAERHRRGLQRAGQRGGSDAAPRSTTSRR